VILGISGGGRANGQTAMLIRAILEASGLESEFISLAGKSISGCRGCLYCGTHPGDCGYKDDWNLISEKMKQATAIVFGAPTYSGNINALSHACIERTYSLRHSTYFLRDKPAVVVSPNEPGNPAELYIERMLKQNGMKLIATVAGCCNMAPCWHCGEGHKCTYGRVPKPENGTFLDHIPEETIPKGFKGSTEAQQKAREAGLRLREALA
jgi:multimeric flavodoxin WrbA